MADAATNADPDTGTAPDTGTTPDTVGALARQLRVDILRMTDRAGSGHPTSSLSAVELVAVLATNHWRYDVDDPTAAGNDRLLFSKGHATPLLYALYRAVGAIDEDELLTYRDRGSRLEGHPTPRLPWVDAATGSLGQGLPIGTGMAEAARLGGTPERVFVLCGDSELSEGSMWEAAEHAADRGLGQLVALVDVNRLGQRGPTRHGWDLRAWDDRLTAFGWDTTVVDGHDADEIDDALGAALADGAQPSAILARTVKGRGVPAAEDQPGLHGKPLDDSRAAIDALGGPGSLTVSPAAPPSATRARPDVPGGEMPGWEVGDELATRDAYGAALAALGDRRGDVVALDAEVSNSTRADRFGDRHPDRFVEAHIAEQNMLGMAVGLAASGWTPFASSFSAFLTRAYDLARMMPVSGVDVRLVGSHAGVSIGPDGPSQMGLEDLAAFRALHDSTVLYPCDANQTAALVDQLADRTGVSYLRTTRGDTPVIYSAGTDFPIGGSRPVRTSDDDEVTVVAAGVTVHEALAAADALEGELPVGVIDAYSVRPLDAGTVVAAAESSGALVVVEDHRPAGGLGEAVAGALVRAGVTCGFTHLAVTHMPGSATPAEQLADAGIDREAITAAARKLAAG